MDDARVIWRDALKAGRIMLLAILAWFALGCTPAVPPGTAVQAYAVRHERLHPEACALLRDFGVVEHPETIFVHVRPRSWPPFLLADRVEIGPDGHPVKLGTPFFVMGEHMYVAEGVFNYPGSYLRATFDLATPKGAAGFCHEGVHVQDARDNGRAWLICQWIRTLLRSWETNRRWWNHQASEFEQHAIQIEEAVLAELQKNPERLAVFKQLQEDGLVKSAIHWD